MITIPVKSFHKGERWFGYNFRLAGDHDIQQTYGSTAEKAKERLIDYLDRKYGTGTYKIQEVEELLNEPT